MPILSVYLITKSLGKKKKKANEQKKQLSLRPSSAFGNADVTPCETERRCICISMRMNLAWCLHCICKKSCYLNNSLFRHIRHYCPFFFACIHCRLYRGKYYSSTWDYWLVWVFPANCKDKNFSVNLGVYFKCLNKYIYIIIKSYRDKEKCKWFSKLQCCHLKTSLFPNCLLGTFISHGLICPSSF